MQQINLKRIIELTGVSATKLGQHLFPDNAYPYKAINRVCTGKSFLNSEQIVKLSEFINVPVGLLFDSAEWRMSMPAGHDRRVIQFRTYDYFAELDLETMTTTVSRNGALFFEKIEHPKSVGLTAYLSSITDLIIKYKY